MCGSSIKGYSTVFGVVARASTQDKRRDTYPKSIARDYNFTK